MWFEPWWFILVSRSAQASFLYFSSASGFQSRRHRKRLMAAATSGEFMVKKRWSGVGYSSNESLQSRGSRPVVNGVKPSGPGRTTWTFEGGDCSWSTYNALERCQWWQYHKPWLIARPSEWQWSYNDSSCWLAEPSLVGCNAAGCSVLMNHRFGQRRA